MLGKYLEEGGGYQALSATTCATMIPLWGHLDENNCGDDGDKGKNNNDDDYDDDDNDAHPACEKDILASLEVELFRSLPGPVM